MIKVLVVDDDKLARKGIISLIREGPYEMQVIGDVQNGRAALEFLEKEKVDLVFVDIDMPEITGLELMQICKERYSELQFVVLTFYEEFQYIQQALRLGALDYISKLRMEIEDCDGLLNRIKSIIESKGIEKSKLFEEQQLQSNENILSEEQQEEFINEWKKLYWIYDDDNFLKLLNDLEKQYIPLRKLEHLFIRLVNTVEMETGKESTVLPVFHDESKFADWLTSWRNELLQWALNSESFDKIPICIIKAINYIQNNISLPLHTEEVGGLVGMSRSYFSVNFKKITGKTYHEFTRRERIKKAKKFLSTCDKGINQIAADVGFEDVNYFNRIFQEETKCTPNNYRKNCKQDSSKGF